MCSQRQKFSLRREEVSLCGESNRRLDLAHGTAVLRGLPYMTFAKLSAFWTPPVTYINQLILFLSSAFFDPPCHIQKSVDFVPFVCFFGDPPTTADVIYGNPLGGCCEVSPPPLLCGRAASRRLFRRRHRASFAMFCQSARYDPRWSSFRIQLN